MSNPLEKRPESPEKRRAAFKVVHGQSELREGSEAEATPLFSQKWLRIAVTVCTILFFVLAGLALSLFGSDNYYTLKKGEDAYTVSSKFNVPVNILLQLNELTHTAEVREGDRIKIPTVHDIHVVREGDTLYHIAKIYGIKRYELVKYNRINGTATLEKGQRLFIPRVLSDIQISTSVKTGLVPFTVMFQIDTNTRDRIRSYKWDLGDGRTSSLRNPAVSYDGKGTYTASLTVVDENGSTVTSNTIPIVARTLALIDFQAPTYVTLNKDEIFSLDAEVIDNLNNSIPFEYQAVIKQNPKLVRQIDKTDKFEIVGSGYSKITFQVKGYEHTGLFFVSPLPSRHVPEPDVDWYRTQYGTGLNGNCGPACVAMSILWSRNGDVDIPVETIRKQIGMPYENGSISFQNMIDSFRRYKIPVQMKHVASPRDLQRVINGDDIALILIHSGKIEQNKSMIQSDLFGRYYTDSVGHYIIIKGYSLDGGYFAVFDPIPGDWYRNSIRYSDGVSMIGKNRYYPAEEVFQALKTRTVLVISPVES